MPDFLSSGYGQGWSSTYFSLCRRLLLDMQRMPFQKRRLEDVSISACVFGFLGMQKRFLKARELERRLR